MGSVAHQITLGRYRIGIFIPRVKRAGFVLEKDLHPDQRALFLFLFCNAATQLATQLHQRRIQVVRSNKVPWKNLTESNGTPAMDLGPMNID